MPRKITASRSSTPRPTIEAFPEEEDEPMQDAEVERTASDSDNNDSDADFEGSDGGAENEDDEDAPDPTPFIDLDVAELSSERYTQLRHTNQFRFKKDATMQMFHTLFQQNVYHVIYANKNFANHRFVKWNFIGKNPAFSGLLRLFKRVGLDSLVALHSNFHAKVVRQFYTTVYVSPDCDHLIWMTGHQRFEASKDDFMQALNLRYSEGVNIHVQECLALTQVDEYYDQSQPYTVGKVSGMLPLPSVVNRIMRSSFFPRSGNNDEIHGKAWNVVKCIMDGTKFDVMDLIIREIATSKGDKTRTIYFAPYIMKLIKRMTPFDLPLDVEHKEYRPRTAPPQAPPPPAPLQGQGSSSQSAQQAPQDQDAVLAALARLQSSVDTVHAENTQMFAMIKDLNVRVTRMDERLTEYQDQRVPLAYQRFGRGQRPPSYTQRRDLPSSSSGAPPF